MMDWVMGAYGGIKAASDITQSMLTLKTDAAVTSKVIELNGVLLGLQNQLHAAHAEHTTLTSKVSNLEAEIAHFKNWEQEKQRYKLHQFQLGTLTYAIKPEVQGSEPLHYICANCYEQGIKSLMQYCEDGWYRALKCHKCSSLIRTEAIPDNGPMVVMSRSPFDDY